MSKATEIATPSTDAQSSDSEEELKYLVDDIPIEAKRHWAILNIDWHMYK